MASRTNAPTLDESVEGLVINKVISCLDIINSLRIIYFFDIVANSRQQAKFIKRTSVSPYNISAEILVKLSEHSYLEQTEIAKTNIVSKLAINFINRYDDYNNGFCIINSENNSCTTLPVLKLPMILSYLEVERLGQLILKNAATETKILRFIIPASFIQYEPCDFIILHYQHCHYQLRIISIKMSCLTMEIWGIIDEVETYQVPVIKGE